MAQNVLTQLLPEKSRARYEAQFNVFTKWCEKKGAKVYTENVLLAYSTDLVNKNKKSLGNFLNVVVLQNSNLNLALPYSKFCARGWEYDLRVCGDQERVEARS
jgi:predicted phosphoadenosine phosphosulfate sulfurtransferase